jgi:hypothetical protein
MSNSKRKCDGNLVPGLTDALFVGYNTHEVL